MPRRPPAVPVHTIGQHCADGDVRDFKVAPFDETACTVAELHECHRHDFFEIVWLKSGAGVHQIDLRDFPYRGSVAFLLAPGQIHRLLPARRADGYVVKFRPALFGDGDPFLDDLLETFLPEADPAHSPVIPIPRHLHAQFEDMFAHMTDEFLAQQRDSHHIFGSFLRILLTQLGRLKRRHDDDARLALDGSHALYRALRLAIERHHRAEHSVNGYARRLRATPRQLNRVAREFAGRSVGALIADRLALAAQRELYHGNASVKALSYALGFADPAYFTRFFRRHTGESPRAFRERAALRRPPGADSTAAP